MKERQENGGQVDEAGEVDVHLLMESCQIDLFRLREIVYALDPCIKTNAINVRILSSNGLQEVVQILAVVDIIYEAVSFAAVLPDKFVDPFLSTANGDDFGTLADEFLGHAQPNARGSPNHKDAFVGE